MMLRALTATLAAAFVMAMPASSQAATLSSTPYMGWNTYYGVGGVFNEATIKSVASELISSGLRDAGYKIVWLDFGWASGARDSNGNLIVDPTQWPDGMSGLTSWLHSQGLEAGIYTDAGTSGCSGQGVGSYGHYAAGSTNPYSQDVNQFAAWGFDAVKVDFCGAGQQWQFQPPHDPRTLYGQFSQAVAATGRSMILNVCDFWDPGAESKTTGVPSLADSSWDAYAWAPAIAQSWRTDTDIGFPNNVVFKNILRNLDQDSTSQTALQATPTIQDAAGPAGASGIAWGHWNDPDYLAPGMGMTDTQAQSQFSMWAMVAAPLMLGADPRNLTQAEIAMLENPNVIAVDQDPLGVQGTVVQQSGSEQVWAKPLVNGDEAVALLNRGSNPVQISTTASAVGLPTASGYHLDDLWTNATTTTDTEGDITALVPADGVTLYRVSPAAPERLSVAVAGDGSGTVSDDSGAIACPGTCSSVYGQGRLVTLTATPSSGSAFAGWSGGGCSGTGRCTVSLHGDTAVTATFVPLHTLTLSVIGAGSGAVTAAGISCPGTCSASYPEGTSVTLTATPAAGSQFGAWLSGGCPAAASTCSVTLSADTNLTVAFDRPRTGTAYVVNGGSNTVTPVELATDTSGPAIRGFQRPGSIAISPDGGTAYVVNMGNGTVTPIDLATNTPEPAIRGLQRPGPLAVSADGKTAYLLEDGRRLIPIDLATDQVEPAMTFRNGSGVGAHAASIALAPNGKTAYLGTFNQRGGSVSGMVAAVDLRSGRLKATVRGFARPAAIVIASNGRTAYVADRTRGNMTAIDLVTNRVIAAPALTARGAFPGAAAAAITADGKTVYVADARHGVTAIDAATRSQTPAAGLAVTGPRGLAITPNGGTAYVTSGGSVIPIDLATDTQRPPLSGFSSPSAIAITNPPPPGESVKLSGRLKPAPYAVSDAVTCLLAASSCTTTETLTVVEGRVMLVVGRRTVRVPARRTVRVTVRLDATGQRLVRRFGSLPVILSVAIRRGGHPDTVAVHKLVIRQ